MSLAKQKIASFLIAFSFLFGVFSLSPVFAVADLKNQEGFGAGGSTAVASTFGATTPKDVRVVVAGLIRSFLGFLGIIFVLLVIYAGFLWMTAGGNESKIEDAKKYLSRSVVGLIIILASYSITGLVICKITDAAGASVFSCMF